MTSREATPRPAAEALFGTFLEGLHDLYARGGMRDVLQLATAASATAPSAPSIEPRPTIGAASAPQLADVRSDALFEALVAALEDAFCHGGLDAAIRELALVGGMVGGAARTHGRADARALPVPRGDPTLEPGTESDRRARRFAQAAYEKAASGRQH
ncbi:MAG TPA: hypothetical protein VLC47_05550 [Burkholderiales bacterium]|nr:hypothetical protein [Burkholderiales bacterium]